MGFNIAGLVIDNNFEQNIEALADALNWELKVENQISFEEASANWIAEEVNVYFGPRGTFVFFPHEWAMNKYHVNGYDSLCFAYSDMSTAFLVSHLDKEGNYRSFIEMEGKRNLEEGIELELESTHKEASALIMALIDETLGESWQSIDFEAKCLQCNRVGFKTAEIRPDYKQPEVLKSQKRWWQFWK